MNISKKAFPVLRCQHEINNDLANSRIAINNLNHHYDQFCNWAEIYENVGLEQRKMIICQLIKEINVSKGYGFDIVMNINYDQFLSGDETLCNRIVG